MAKLVTVAIAGAILALAACSTLDNYKGYTICNDMNPNVTCPNNTANVIVR